MDRLLLFCIVLAVTPASILLFLILMIGMGIEESFLQLGKLSEWLSAIATSITALIAFFAYNSWKGNLSASWDRDVKLKLQSELYKIASFSSEIMQNYNTIEDCIITLRHHNWEEGTTPPPPPYPEMCSIDYLKNLHLEEKCKFNSASENLQIKARELDELCRDFVKDNNNIIRSIEIFTISSIVNKGRLPESIKAFNNRKKLEEYKKINKISLEILNHSPF